MADIKVKQSKKGTIKTIDKSRISTQKLKDKLVQAKAKENNVKDTSQISETDYAINKINNTTKKSFGYAGTFNKYGKSSYNTTRDNIYKVTDKITSYQYKVGQNRKNAIKNIPTTIKKNRNTIKTSEKMAKTTKQTVKNTTKVTQKTAKIIRNTTKATIHAVKATIKATTATVKAMIAGAKLLIAAIIAGGWFIALIVIIICMVAMLCNSIFGIFFSNENTQNSGRNMVSIISEVNSEFVAKISEIQRNTKHDEYIIESNRAEWKDILSIYTAKVSKGKDETDIMFLTDQRIEELKIVFWDMNNISSTTTKEVREITMEDENGNTKTEKVEYTILHITITSKSVKEMEQLYKFSNKQKLQVAELLNDQYAKMWSNVIYGSSMGSNDIVAIAKQQIGNVGGKPYWSWYGFKNRVEWCACFVSWCANQCGYIEKGIIPKFSNCQGEGVAWFKSCGLWQERGYIPKEGDIIFFDWVGDGKANHVGIVEKVENEKVYTIEGNTGNDMCKEKNYNLDSKLILGYGTPMY